ncbi:RecQ family ATP-dependent DNA helicase [Geopsychrobacter electrodiphilus]|uniref:RecQ family ATP-dependent DNA helicase n=1 Tax=Geopsychrobacter electrodiphilus TaxID=225196 RepID=UPI000372925C|nr:RecQ family ATP-dependent DNA helicase [Geopsychrobacter electrodiphilus]
MALINVNSILKKCLCLDLETTLEGKIFKIGAVYQEGTFERQGKFNLQTALAELDQFGAGATYVLGHNLLGHDLPLLETVSPNLSLLKKPVIDTLYLSPLAFPENPYHRLVKDYKLVRQSINDPVADAQLAASIFADQWEAFEELRHHSPQVIDFYRFCFENSEIKAVRWDGLSEVFKCLGAATIELEDSLRTFNEITVDKVCTTALRTVAKQYVWDPAECATLAYCVAWLRVAGHNSVLPPWVRHRFPSTVSILRQLRDIPCTDPNCDYCRLNHDPVGQLERYFGFSAFRPVPAAPDGSSLQESIVRHGMSDQSQLAILPTGGGKSLCFQIPALVRNFRRGTLTIVVSPLQALMKDQVDNLVANTGTPFAAALYGMLTPPERGQVLESVRMGDIAILYVSPEQLRNRSFREVISQREIGCWVFDEAHCLSKWGHDFRTDYLYAARFIREFSQEQKVPIPAIACFTATAKKDVSEEIVDYFRRELGQELRLFEGGVDRNNLHFEVQTVGRAEKFERVYDLLADRLDSEGAAVVYAATRKRTEEISEYLVKKGIVSDAFHAGLKAPNKKQIQEDFIAGKLQVICATNAFGMGIDKDNVRLVIHAEIPGSLENYLQEAGRAGRDQQDAECVLLYDEQDIETQFKMGAFSELTLNDIMQILRGLKKAKRNRAGEIVITTGEILRSDAVDTSFDSSDNSADTKVKTAVAWLERAGIVERNHNSTGVFQGRPAIKNIEEAREKISALNLPALTKRRWFAVLAALMNANPDEGLSADKLAELPEFLDEPIPDAEGKKSLQENSDSQRILQTLNDMAEAGLIKRDLLLTAFVRYKVGNHSLLALEKVCTLEKALLKLLQEEEPDAEGWLHLSLRRLNQRLLDEGFISIPEFLYSIFNSLARDGRGLAGQRGSLELKSFGTDLYRVKLHRGWDALIKTSELRSSLAKNLLDAIIAKIPDSTPASASILVEFSLDDLVAALKGDLFLSGQVKNELAAIERALMFLHEQEVIVLQQGLAVFRQAMTIKLLEQKRRYTKGDYSPLADHYKERTFQVHVMNEYARLGAEKIQIALGLVAAYFTMDKFDFVKRFFAGRKEILDRATSQESFRRIVDNLENPVQMAIVSAPTTENMLVLAGPGSGKTRVVVHRCAYLLRVERIPSKSILVLCFNRQAAGELRRRLWDLIGPDAIGVTVLTYHGLAMRLTGTSFADRLSKQADEVIDFDQLIDKAIRLLKGEEDIPGVVQDDLRDRLLAGYQHILVDEYQDIDQRQYDLVSAIAGRTLDDDDAKLTIMAVGDDDQNIYSFRGANVAFIRQFEEDYQAKFQYLVENFRSTANIIAVGNAHIFQNQDRMKTEYPIRINKGRERLDAGGDWTHLDSFTKGRVQILAVENRQAQANILVAQLEKLKKHNPSLQWFDCAVLARTHEELAPIRAALEHVEIPVAYGRQDLSLPIGRVREITQLFDALEPLRNELKRARDLEHILAKMPGQNSGKPNIWWELLTVCLQAWHEETGNAELPVKHAIDYLWEALAEQKRERFMGRGVFLSTVHFAKGMEFDHVYVSDGGWDAHNGEGEEERRVYYVAMTRARQTLTLFERDDDPNPYCKVLVDKLPGDKVFSVRPVVDNPLPEAILRRRYEIVGLRDVYLDYAGRLSESDAVHQHLTNIGVDSLVQLKAKGEKLEVCTQSGHPIAMLSKGASERWTKNLNLVESLKVIAMVERRADDSQDLDYKKLLKVDRWDVPVLEVVWAEGCDL